MMQIRTVFHLLQPQFKCLQRCRFVSLAAVQLGRIYVGRDELRLQFDRRSIGGDGITDVALIGIQTAEIQLCFRTLGIELLGLYIFSDCRVQHGLFVCRQVSRRDRCEQTGSLYPDRAYFIVEQWEYQLYAIP